VTTEVCSEEAFFVEPKRSAHQPDQNHGKISPGVRAGFYAGLGAGLVNVLLLFMARATGVIIEVPAQGTSGPLTRLPWFSPLIATLVPLLVAGLFYSIGSRSVAKPVRPFQVLTVILTLLTLTAPFQAGLAGTPLVVLISMHIITGCGALLIPRFAR
jgi:hypothetical protein